MKDRIKTKSSKTCKIQNIIINPEYQKLVPSLIAEDYNMLKISIQKHGIEEPLTLNQDNVLLDGHTRRTIAIQLGIRDVPYDKIEFVTKREEKKYVVETNLERRHLNHYQKVELGMPLLETEEIAASKRKHKPKDFKFLTPGSNDPNQEKGKSVEKVAKKIGVSSTTLMRGKHVLKHASEDQKERLRKGKTSINSIYNEVTRKDRNLPTTKLPSGKWSVVMCDLPIQFDNKSIRGSSTNNYPTISIPELKLGIINNQDVRKLFADDCVIFAWFQASTIFDAKTILSSWGFECKTNIIWHKNRIGTGSWLKNQHEHLVIAVKGSMPLPVDRPLSVQKPETKYNIVHSSKPYQFYDLVQELYPKRKYLDLFSRYQHNKDWTTFGDEPKKKRVK